jgi:hypothetical protein
MGRSPTSPKQSRWPWNWRRAGKEHSAIETPNFIDSANHGRARRQQRQATRLAGHKPRFQNRHDDAACRPVNSPCRQAPFHGGPGLALPVSMSTSPWITIAKVPWLTWRVGGIGNRRARLPSLFHYVLDVFDREVRPHDRLLIRRQRIPDPDEGAVCLGCNPGLPKIGAREAKGEAVRVLVEPSQGVHLVADALEAVNGPLGTPLSMRRSPIDGTHIPAKSTPAPAVRA